MGEIESISAVTLATRNMAKSVKFYRTLGFKLRYGGEEASFTSFMFGSNYINLTLQTALIHAGWGRVIFYVGEVDRFYESAKAQGLQPDFEPRDAAWGERYFHITDPDGHELSFAKRIRNV